MTSWWNDILHSPEFPPTQINFKEGKVGAGWSVEQAAVAEGGADVFRFVEQADERAADLGTEGAWLFSTAYHLMSGLKYEVRLKCQVQGHRGGAAPRLVLRLGYSPDPAGQNQQIAEFTPATTGEVDTFSTTFEVQWDGNYYLSLEGQPGDGVLALVEGMAALEGQLSEPSEPGAA